MVNIFGTRKAKEPEYKRIDTSYPQMPPVENLPPMPSPSMPDNSQFMQTQNYMQQQQQNDLQIEELTALMEYHMGRVLEIYNILKTR